MKFTFSKMVFGASVLAAAASVNAQIVINEIDAQTPGTDAVEFIEIYNAGGSPVDLAAGDYVVVLINGSGEVTYNAIDLLGTLNAGDYLVLGSATVPNVDQTVFTTNGLQNGDDAVALYSGADAATITNGTLASAIVGTLEDVVLYDDNGTVTDADLIAEFPAAPQLREDGNGDADNESMQRSPDGSGGAAWTGSANALASPGTANVTPPSSADISSAVAAGGDIIVTFTIDPGAIVTGDVTLTYDVSGTSSTATIDSVSGSGVTRTLEVTPDPTTDALIDDIAITAGVNGNLNFFAYPTIAAIQTGLVANGVVSTIGTISAVQDSNGRFAIASAPGANNGIVIDNNVGTTATLSNSVEVLGSLGGADFKEIDLDNLSDFIDLGAATPITPTVVAAADFQSTATTNTLPADQWEGVLITVNGLTGPTDVGFGERRFDQNVQTDDFFFATADDQIDLGDVPGAVYNITGIANFNFGNYKILPGSNADIDVTPPASIQEWELLD